jgi:CRISPR-associated protein Csx17
MTTQVHRLEGCSPTPLAHYLKALAVLRLVSEQRDPEARCFWKEEALWLSTSLSREELVNFFVATYEPTPILSPWNAGSGFYFREAKGDEKSELTGRRVKSGVRSVPTAATRAVDQLIACDSPRLAAYRECATLVRSILRELGLLEAPEKEAKAELIARLRSRLPEQGIRWMDAAVTSAGEEFECAPLVGSGGNDGNEDFSKQFLERVLKLTGASTEPARSLVESCLFAKTALGALDTLAGQFFPAGNGGTNAGAGFSGRSTANEWDYILAVEGSLVFAGAATRRLDASTSGAAFPFAVRIDAVGYPSAADADREASRSEVWLPLWAQPASLSNVHALLAEGRIRIDRADARRTTDVVRAIASLGTSRGITGFERTAFFTRNGNMHYSAPVGRWQVTAQAHGELLDDITPWLRTFSGFARDKVAPKLVTSAARMIDEAILGVCRAGNEPVRWQALLVALGRAESALLRSPSKAGDPKRRLSPLPPLRPAWISAAGDGSPEFRLAVALACQDVVLRSDGKEAFANVRAHWMPLDRSRVARRACADRLPAAFATLAGGLAHDPDVVCAGDNLERDCIALVRRRVQIAYTLSARNLGLAYAPASAASLADVTAFLAGGVDDARILALSRPLMAIACWKEELPRLPRPPREEPDAIYAVVRTAHLSQPLDRGREQVTIRLDPEPIARLSAGDLASALAVCLRRLRASGLSPTIRVAGGDERYARRLAASLAFPIHAGDMSRCADLITKPFELEESSHG